MPFHVEVYEFVYQGNDEKSEVMRVTVAATSKVPQVDKAALRHLSERMRKNGTPILAMTRVEEGRQAVDLQARHTGIKAGDPQARQVANKALFLIRGGLGGAILALFAVQECVGSCVVPMLVW